MSLQRLTLHCFGLGCTDSRFPCPDAWLLFILVHFFQRTSSFPRNKSDPSVIVFSTFVFFLCAGINGHLNHGDETRVALCSCKGTSSGYPAAYIARTQEAGRE